MKILPPNYTQAPNLCFDEIFKTLKEGELRVILVLIRQTFGWHKSFDRISLSQLAEKSGLDRRSVCRSLNSLIEKGLVIKNKFGEKGQERCYFSLMMDSFLEEETPEDGNITEEEMEILSKSLYQCPKVTPPSDLKSLPQGHKVTTPSDIRSPTKETPTKEREQQQQTAAASLKIDPKTAAAFPIPPVVIAPTKPSSIAESLRPVYASLLHLDIPDADKWEITGRYKEDIVINAIEWALHPTTKLTKGLAPAIKWACVNAPSVPKLAQPEKQAIDFASYNRSYWRDIAKELWHNGLRQIADGLGSSTESLQTQNSKIYFKDKSFLEQLESYLRKCDVKTKQIYDMINLCRKNLAMQ